MAKSDTLGCLEHLPSLDVFVMSYCVHTVSVRALFVFISKSAVDVLKFCMYLKSKKEQPQTKMIMVGGESMEKAKDVNVKAELSSQEWQLIQMIRALDYGQLTITVKASKPIHVEEVRKSIPLK